MAPAIKATGTSEEPPSLPVPLPSARMLRRPLRQVGCRVCGGSGGGTVGGRSGGTDGTYLMEGTEA